VNNNLKNLNKIIIINLTYYVPIPQFYNSIKLIVIVILLTILYMKQINLLLT